jgi:hypothetical protein
MGCRVTSIIKEEKSSLLKCGLHATAGCDRKRRKTEEERKRQGERVQQRRGREERKFVFSHSQFHPDWGFICGPILMKF